MDFGTGLPISTDWEKDSYNSISIIIDYFKKIVYYELIKVTINIPCLAKVIIDVIIRNNSLSDSIVTNKGFLFISKIWSSLCYIFGIKQYLFTRFKLQTKN